MQYASTDHHDAGKRLLDHARAIQAALDAEAKMTEALSFKW